MARKPVKRTRVTSKQIDEHRTPRGRKHGPNFNGWEEMTGEQYHIHRRKVTDQYYSEYKANDLLPDLYDWMKNNNYSAEDIKYVKAVGTSGMITVAIYAKCLQIGMPDYNKKHDEYWQSLSGTMGPIRPVTEFLKENIEKAIYKGQSIKVEEVVEEKKDIYIPTIQDRLREASASMTEELECAIDDYINNPDNFDPKTFKVASLLRGKGVKAAHARIIKSFYNGQFDEYNELLSNDPDPQLVEGYKSYNKKNIKKMHEFLSSIINACDQLIGEAKINRAPRRKKIKPAEDLVKKLKFLKTDDSLGIVSVPPTQIIGAKQVWIYNNKTRKLGCYVAQEYQEISVRGTTLTNFDENRSKQKTLRKPAEQLKSFKGLNTQKRMETWFDKEVKTTDIKMNGRFNDDTIILKVY